MRHQEWRNGQTLIQLNGLVIFETFKADVVKGDQLLPRCVTLNESPHSGHDMNRYFLCPHDFFTQVNQAHVVADVGMSQKDAGQRPLRIGYLIEGVQLLRKARRTIDQPPFLSEGVDDGQAGRQTLTRAVFPGPVA